MQFWLWPKRRDLWPTFDAPGKRAYLLKCGVRMLAQREADGRVSAVIESEGYWHDVSTLGGFENAEAAADYYLTQPAKAMLAERGLSWDEIVGVATER